MQLLSFTGLFAVVLLNYAAAQIPPRLQIPGAIPVEGSRPIARNPGIISNPRLRRPNAIPSTTREVRPVVEENEEPNYPAPLPSASSPFDEEVNKLTFSLQNTVRDEEEEYRYRGGQSERPSQLQFRPERPVPISREQIREKIISRPPPPPAPTRAVIRQDIREDPVPRPARQQITRPAKIPQRQVYDDEEDLRDRRRKPVVQILRKYRTDNEDGSITWGFENDDGTFKEETLGADCIIRGKYGYIDPDDVKREFSYEAGNKCDEPDLEDEEDLLPQKANIPQAKNRPLPYRVAQAQPQYVKAQPQFVN